MREGGVVFGGGGVRALARGYLRGVPEEQQREGALQGGHAGEFRGAVDDPGLLIYERALPALAGSVARIRRELIETLARHDLAADRRADVAAVVREAATNAVLHAYGDPTPGPLYAAAAVGGDSLTVWISDSAGGCCRAATVRASGSA
jgi:hypothetical protein